MSAHVMHLPFTCKSCAYVVLALYESYERACPTIETLALWVAEFSHIKPTELAGHLLYFVEDEIWGSSFPQESEALSTSLRTGGMTRSEIDDVRCVRGTI